MRWMLIAAMTMTMFRSSGASAQAFDPDAYLRKKAIADERAAIERGVITEIRPSAETGWESLCREAFPFVVLGCLIAALQMLRRQGKSLDAALDKLSDIERRLGPDEDDEDSIEARRARLPMQTAGQ